MRLSDYIREDLILLETSAASKDLALSRLVQIMQEKQVLADGKKFLQEVLERERLGSTCIGNGVALPHARTQAVDQIVIALMRIDTGISFQSEDKEPVRLIFLLGTPIKAVGEYLKVLSRLSKILKDDKIRKSLLTAETPAMILDIISHAED